ncbi:MAG TPA: hypothetical protein VEG65_00080 [Candidatus Bathyarchaeia archaeon]|nr:hypothetical protein [Candidatus Bathyarchaeia archaeon]
MEGWRARLAFDPVPPLGTATNDALRYHVRRDLLDEAVLSPAALWELPAVRRLLRKQKTNGSWRYPGTRRTSLRSADNYDQLETYRIVGELVEKFGITRDHPAMRRAAEFLFSHQTEGGDFRGIYGTQYSPNYTAAIMELLIKGGYGRDERVAQGFRWLFKIRQRDAGWAIPVRTMGEKLDARTMNGDTIEPDRTKPFSHFVTGIVLRAFAADEGRRRSAAAKNAGKLLVSRFFRRDAYPDRSAADFWTRFSYPFWFTDLLSSLDSLSRLGFGRKDSGIAPALEWFVDKQQPTGTWDLKILRGADKALPLWLSFAICRVVKTLYE